MHGVLCELDATDLLLLPLVVDGAVTGGVGLIADSDTPFTDVSVQLAWEVVEQLSGSLTRIWLSEERERLSAALEQTDSSVMSVTTP